MKIKKSQLKNNFFLLNHLRNKWLKKRIVYQTTRNLGNFQLLKATKDQKNRMFLFDHCIFKRYQKFTTCIYGFCHPLRPLCNGKKICTLLQFLICRAFPLTVKVVKKRQFKVRIIFYWMESFFYCLSSNIFEEKYQNTTAKFML